MGPDQAAAFDGIVAVAARPDFLQSWGWGDLKATTGWRPHRLRFIADGNRTVGACSVLERSIPGLGSLLYAPRGPILDWSDGPVAARAMRELTEFARNRHAIALKCDPALPTDAPGCAATLAAAGFRRIQAGPSFEGVQPMFVMHLDLAGRDQDALLGAMSPKTRYNIRLSARKGVTVRVGEEPDLRTFYDLLLETAHRDGFTVRSFAYFQAMWRHVLRPGLGYLLLADADGQALAGAIIFQMGNTAWYLYGASSSRRRDLMAPYAVQWEAITRALRDGKTRYDFRGVSGDLSPDHPLYGLYRFKHGFGAYLVEYVGEWDLALRPAAHWAAGHALPVARHVMARLRRQAGTPPEQQ